jgi:hypothetical protein
MTQKAFDTVHLQTQVIVIYSSSPSGIHTSIGVYWIRIKVIGKRYLELEYNMIIIGNMWLYLCPTISVHTIPHLMLDMDSGSTPSYEYPSTNIHFTVVGYRY